MLVNSFTFVTLLLINISKVHGFCRSYDQLSTVGVEHEYYDDYGEITCCETVYPVLFSYIKCIRTTLTTEQQLSVESNTNNARYIKFEESKIPLVPVGVFTSFANLTQLYLNDSIVENVHPGAFTGLTNLEELYLQNNKLSKLLRGTLNSLRNLKLLDLSNNKLESIEEHALVGLANLQNFSLSRNNLKNVLADTFDNLNELNNLDLSHNHLLDILPKLYINLINLHQLNLSHNNLTNFDFYFLPRSLKQLDLTFNQINYVENWPKLKNLQELNLSHNRLLGIETIGAILKNLNISSNGIVKINSSPFEDGQELTTLDLSYNVISNLSHGTFEGFFNLNYLYLQNNHLVNIPVGCFRNLKLLNLLNLSHNKIVDFEFGTFSDLVGLKALDISYNQLSYLYESSLHTLKNLTYLNIDDNLITTLDPFDLLLHTINLKNISFNNNPWNCKSLVKIVKAFEQKNVTVAQGSTKNSQHIYGMFCLNYNYSKFNSVLNVNSTNETSIDLLRNISKEVKDLHSTIKKDSQSSSIFFKYLEDGFKNTTSFEFLNQDISNTTFFRSLNQILKSFQGLELFDNKFRNTSMHGIIQNDTLRNELSNYFKNLFKDASSTPEEVFYFLKYLKINSKTLNCSSPLLHTDNNLVGDNREIFSKISELKNSNISSNCLMIIVIIILLIIMVLLIFSQIKTFSNYRHVTAHNDSSCQPNEAVELI